MKFNKILMVLAATAIVGCTSDDLNNFTAKQAPEDSRLIQLDENFTLAGVGVEGDVTRTHWEEAPSGALVNKFLPILYASNAGDLLAGDAILEEQAVGLCWLGEGTVGTDVYTNYQFYHYGWLKNGESEAKVVCAGTPYASLTNGATYDEIQFIAGGLSYGDEADETDFQFAVAKDFPIANLNYNSGLYRTDNKAIFGGKYVAYYPFNEDFNEIGTIPAVAETAFNPVSESYDTPEVGHATFRYSAPVEIKGGAQASGFGLYNLSTLVQLRVAGPRSTTIGKNIDQIVLWSKSEKLLKQANLAADKIVAGKKGTELYTKTEGTKTIVATFNAPVAVKATNNDPTSAYITVLPTTVEDLVVYVHSDDGKWATINVGHAAFEAGKAKRFDIPVTAASFKNEFFAVDERSLNDALTDARAVASATNPVKITVIGDIELANDTWINNPADKYITIEGDDIIVPENIALTLYTNMGSDVRVLGKECCTDPTLLGGRLTIEGGMISNVTMEPADPTVVTAANYDDYSPKVVYSMDKVEVAAGAKFDAQAGKIDVDAAVAHKANINIAEGVKVTVSATGDLNFMGATVVNNGTIEVKKEGKFDMTNQDGNATASDGKRMTNNGTFIHNVDAAVGTAVQSMNQNGEYRCKVNKQIKLDDAYQKWTACSVIEMVEAGQNYDLGVAEKNINYKHNGKFIDIEVNTTSVTTFTNPANSLGNGDDKNIQVGKLTVMQGGLYVPYVTGEGKRELTVNGDFTASVNVSLWTSKKITVKENLIVNNGAELKYAGEKQNEGGLAVEKDIKVSGAATKFNAAILKVDALDITCANFTLADRATAEFGNRTEGDTKNLTVSGTITNPAGCTFDILAANQVGGSILATITCKTLIVGGNWGVGGKPQVVE